MVAKCKDGNVVKVLQRIKLLTLSFLAYFPRETFYTKRISATKMLTCLICSDSNEAFDSKPLPDAAVGRCAIDFELAVERSSISRLSS